MKCSAFLFKKNIGMNRIREQGYNEIILHVAEWNRNAVKLYLKAGFNITKKETVARKAVKEVRFNE